MDYDAVLEDLKRRRYQLSEAIDALEALENGGELDQETIEALKKLTES